MKRKGLIFLLILILFLGSLMVYQIVTEHRIREETTLFLASRGYSPEDVSRLEINHSFLNRLLGYNEWRIFITFHREPDITFAFTWRGGSILRQGVSSDALLNKEEILAFERKFDNGELKLP